MNGLVLVAYIPTMVALAMIPVFYVLCLVTRLENVPCRASWQGYADKLKADGMVNINLQGEDISKIRRQQFEVRTLHNPYTGYVCCFQYTGVPPVYSVPDTRLGTSTYSTTAS